jgi:hypothetical protein
MGKGRRLAKELIREVCGYAPYERRIMELCRNGLDKRALKLAKKKVTFLDCFRIRSDIGRLAVTNVRKRRKRNCRLLFAGQRDNFSVLFVHEKGLGEGRVQEHHDVLSCLTRGLPVHFMCKGRFEMMKMCNHTPKKGEKERDPPVIFFLPRRKLCWSVLPNAFCEK